MFVYIYIHTERAINTRFYDLGLNKLSFNSSLPLIQVSALLTMHAVDPVPQNQAQQYKPH